MRRGSRLLLVAGLFGAIAGPTGWVISDRLEANDRFCVSCHLREDQPLHEAKFERFRGAPATDLAAAHHAAKGEIACIDCHGGASLPNKVRVKTVAARDALRYFAGAFDEPDRMAHPLWDEDCVQCHASFEAARDDAFHALAAHNTDFAYRCVDCHRAHDTRADRELWFTIPEVIGPVCHNCHEEL